MEYWAGVGTAVVSMKRLMIYLPGMNLEKELRSKFMTKMILFPAITDAPIRCSGKLWNNVFKTPEEILANILNYYRSNTLAQIYRIVGSLDFVGNPSMVINSFIKVARDFVRHYHV